MTDLERELNEALQKLWRRARDEAGFDDKSFLPMFGEYGPLATVQRLVLSPTVPHGFTKLWERRRLDLTVEYELCARSGPRSPGRTCVEPHAPACSPMTCQNAICLRRADPMPCLIVRSTCWCKRRPVRRSRRCWATTRILHGCRTERQPHPHRHKRDGKQGLAGDRRQRRPDDVPGEARGFVP
jgi:hypothetical protein